MERTKGLGMNKLINFRHAWSNAVGHDSVLHAIRRSPISRVRKRPLDLQLGLQPHHRGSQQ